ncbi:hypothetical protein A2U01_0076926, partial [Trifolium medium]|nr:hypothetical protein [Trifolium medium]
EEGVMELVELSKIPMIVGSKRFFGSTERCTPGAEEGGESCGGYLKSYGSGMQDLHEGGRHYEG